MNLDLHVNCFDHFASPLIKTDVRTVEVVVLIYQSFFSYLTPQHPHYPSYTQNLLLAAVLPRARLVTLAVEVCILSVYLVAAGHNGWVQLGGCSN